MKEGKACQQLVSSLSDYVDGCLDEALCAELERHLEGCEDCQVVVNTMKKTIELYRKAEPGDDVPAEVRTRLYARLNLEDYLRPKEQEAPAQ
ncbi:MAG TPA: anti-sigma factor [Anaerolineaceae bacterium]